MLMTTSKKVIESGRANKLDRTIKVDDDSFLKPMRLKSCSNCKVVKKKGSKSKTLKSSSSLKLSKPKKKVKPIQVSISTQITHTNKTVRRLKLWYLLIIINNHAVIISTHFPWCSKGILADDVFLMASFETSLAKPARSRASPERLDAAWSPICLHEQLGVHQLHRRRSHKLCWKYLLMYGDYDVGEEDFENYLEDVLFILNSVE